MSAFGLVGKNISYSFSKSYFKQKFSDLNLNYSYSNFDVQNIEDFFKQLPQISNLKGFNVTIPYKEAIIPYLNSLHPTAKSIGAVNTVKVTNNQLTGYNTDYIGFNKALKPLLTSAHKRALILGTGGASKAVIFGLTQLKIDVTQVSRMPAKNQLSYNQLNETIFKSHQLIINTTPLGTFPNIDAFPDIPYQYLSKNHISYDLIYNPTETIFLNRAKQRGAIILNGERMLIEQAEQAWAIWNK